MYRSFQQDRNETENAEYELLEELGRGAFGVVRRGVDLSTGQAFAVKIINTSRMSKQNMKSIENEANICRMLRHKNVVQLHDSFHYNGKYFMIFDLVTGGELFEDIVSRDHYSETCASYSIFCVLDALGYCHANNIIHRDLKPENILLSSKHRNAVLKIADFGLAIRVPDNNPRRYGIAGTYTYMAPEVLLERAYAKPVDMWSCGVILYLLLSGTAPFHARDESRLCEKIIRGKYYYPHEEWGCITTAAKDLVDRLLTQNPYMRITAEEALRHPWLRAPHHTAANVHLEKTVIQLRTFNARRKFKGAVITLMAAKTYFSPKSNTDHSDLSTITITRENPGIQLIRQIDEVPAEFPRNIQFAEKPQDKRPMDWFRSVSFTGKNQLDLYHPRLPSYGNHFRYINYPPTHSPEMVYYPSYKKKRVQRRNVWYLL